MNEKQRNETVEQLGSIHLKLKPIKEGLDQLLIYTGAGEYPPVGLIDDVQRALEQYLSYLNRRKSAMKVVFRNTPGKTVTSEEVSAELCAVPGAVHTLMQAGLKKIIRRDDSGMNQDMLNWLQEKEYIAEISAPDAPKAEYFTLTEKGRSCFRRDLVKSGVYKDTGVIMMPEALSVEPESWDALMLRRAELLHRYYSGRGIAHMLFPLSAGSKLLMGCEISGAAQTHYSLAWVEDEMLAEAELEALQKLLSSGEVAELTLITETAHESERAQAVLKKLDFGKTKVEQCALEDVQ